MRRILMLLSACLWLGAIAVAASKPHVISFGRISTVKWKTGADEEQVVELKVRGLYVDGRLREFTVGSAHEVTDRIFVIQRAFRMNDALPQEKGKDPQWLWQRGGWLMVDRLSGRISSLPLPDFDPYYSTVSWYRDYAAYWGITGEGSQRMAVVVQLGRRKPVLRKEMGATVDGAASGLPGEAPAWQRPGRVTFRADQGYTYSIHGSAAIPVVDEIGENETE